MPDLNANDIEAAKKIVAGTARHGRPIEGREMKTKYVPPKGPLQGKARRRAAPTWEGPKARRYHEEGCHMTKHGKNYEAPPLRRSTASRSTPPSRP